MERATKDYLTILNQIIEKNPGVQIVVQSVTPMADSSTSYSEKLNNEQINAFNETMKAYCQVLCERGRGIQRRKGLPEKGVLQ